MQPLPGIALANEILGCGSFDDIASKLLPHLTDFFNAGSSCAFEMRRDVARLRLDRAVQLRMPAGAMAAYDAHFVGLDPVCAPVFATGGLAPDQAGVVRLSDRCPSKALLDSSYYNDFLRSVHIRHVFGMMVRPRTDPSRVVVLGFHRPRAAADFAIELEQAAALVPALQASVERMCFRDRVRDTPLAAFDAWADGVGLTAREADVARQVARGLRNAEVAERFDLSLRTVENHLRSIFAKAQVRSRTELVCRIAG